MYVVLHPIQYTTYAYDPSYIMKSEDEFLSSPRQDPACTHDHWSECTSVLELDLRKKCSTKVGVNKSWAGRKMKPQIVRQTKGLR